MSESADRRLIHKVRMIERRAAQVARKSTTLVMTRPKWRGIVSALKADIERANNEREHPLDKPIVYRKPAVSVVLVSKYMPHQGKRERARRALPVVHYAEAA